MTKKEELWKELIENYNQSGKTQKQWCKENGYPESKLKYWLYKRSDIHTTQPSPTFVKLSKKTDVTDERIELKINNVNIILTPGFNKGLLKEVVEVLG